VGRRKGCLLQGESLIAKRSIAMHVKNAVILAAGKSLSFAPFSYETPKALFKVKGETLIERLIRQLKEAGVENVAVVVGSMREKLYFLEDKWGVRIIENSLYASKNNIYSLQLARDYLGDGFLCHCDNYYPENPFLKHEPSDVSYRQAIAKIGLDGEFNCYVDSKDCVSRITVNDIEAGLSLIGYAYLTKDFAQKFISLYDETQKGLCADRLFWEEFVGMHLDKLRLHVKRVAANEVLEFDSVEEVREFDPTLIDNLNSGIVKNICTTLNCVASEITGIKALTKGLTNVSFLFSVREGRYVYRHPGGSSSSLVNRYGEFQAQNIAYELCIDKTLVYIHPHEGWKISHYVEGAYDFDYRDVNALHEVLRLLRKLHTCGKSIEYVYDPLVTADKMMALACNTDASLRSTYAQTRAKLGKLFNYTRMDGVLYCLCHNDSYWPNFLISNNSLDLIDWEYAGMCDPANDFGGIIGRDKFHDDNEIEDLLAAYLGHNPTAFERRHYFSFIPISAWVYFCWSLFKAGVNEPNGFFMHDCYRQISKFTDRMLAEYEGVRK